MNKPKKISWNVYLKNKQINLTLNPQRALNKGRWFMYREFLGFRRKKSYLRKINRIPRAFKRLSFNFWAKYKQKIIVLKKYLYKQLRFSYSLLREFLRVRKNNKFFLGVTQKYLHLLKYRLFLFLIYSGGIKLNWNFFEGYISHRIERSTFFIKQGFIYINSKLMFNINYLLNRCDLIEYSYIFLLKNYFITRLKPIDILKIGSVSTGQLLKKNKLRDGILERLQHTGEIVFNNALFSLVLINFNFAYKVRRLVRLMRGKNRHNQELSSWKKAYTLKKRVKKSILYNITNAIKKQRGSLIRILKKKWWRDSIYFSSAKRKEGQFNLFIKKIMIHHRDKYLHKNGLRNNVKTGLVFKKIQLNRKKQNYFNFFRIIQKMKASHIIKSKDRKSRILKLQKLEKFSNLPLRWWRFWHKNWNYGKTKNSINTSRPYFFNSLIKGVLPPVGNYFTGRDLKNKLFFYLYVQKIKKQWSLSNANFVDFSMTLCNKKNSFLFQKSNYYLNPRVSSQFKNQFKFYSNGLFASIPSVVSEVTILKKKNNGMFHQGGLFFQKKTINKYNWFVSFQEQKQIVKKLIINMRGFFLKYSNFFKVNLSYFEILIDFQK